MKIIAFYGPQGAGKSESAKAVASLPRWHRVSFAGPLYDMMSALLGTDARSLPKNEPLDALCGKTLRYALQHLGTEWGRGMVGDTVWLEALSRRIEEHRAAGSAGVVIDDLRFANEYRLLFKMGAKIVRVERERTMVTTMNGGHASEKDWIQFTPDTVIVNGAGVDELWTQAKDTV
tara:strand:+ start:343 stop:870 length:528 start_codon:yes stop_codon:yes gene_type:complete